jgi:hypothetical protein
MSHRLIHPYRAPIALLLTLLCTACTGVADLSTKLGGLGVVSEDISTFDNSITVEVSPNWLYDPNGSWGNSVKLGARWNSQQPNRVYLKLSHASQVMTSEASYLLIQGIDINVEGEIHSFETGNLTNFDSSDYNTVTKDIYTESSNYVEIPVSLLDKMLSANDVRLRIYTSEGYEDSIFTIERMTGGGATAIISIREFKERINFIGEPATRGITDDTSASETSVKPKDSHNHERIVAALDNVYSGSHQLTQVGWMSIASAARAAAAFPRTEQLLKQKQWGDLIEHVKQIDYGDDLHNYLLARSLYELGFIDAALIYVETSIFESSRTLRGKCIECLDFSFPVEAQILKGKILSAQSRR